jgi:hypothetical protein
LKTAQHRKRSEIEPDPNEMNEANEMKTQKDDVMKYVLKDEILENEWSGTHGKSMDLLCDERMIMILSRTFPG